MLTDRITSPDDPLLDALCEQWPDIAPSIRRAKVQLLSEDASERRLGTMALSRCVEKNPAIEPAVFQRLTELLKDPDSEVREAAEFGFEDLGEPGLRRLLHVVEARQHSVQLTAQLVRAIGHFKYANATIPLWNSAKLRLAGLFHDASPKLRGAVAVTMADLDERSPEFIERLLRMCCSVDDDERCAGLVALREASEDQPEIAAQAEDAFLRALGESEPGAQEAVQWGLRDRGPDVVPKLLKRFDEGNPAVQAHVFQTLARFMSENVPAAIGREIAQRCLAALGDTNPAVRKAAAYAVSQGRCDDAEAKGAVTGWLHGMSKHVRRIAGLSPAVKHPAIGPLLKMCEAADPDERTSALHALWCIAEGSDGGRIREGREIIAANLQHENSEVRNWAYNLQPSLAMETTELISILAQGLDDSCCGVAGRSAVALKEVAQKGADVSAAVPALCRVIARRECDGSLTGAYRPFDVAVEILTIIPVEKAKPSIAGLHGALSSKEARTVAAAAIALWKIDRQVADSLPRLKRLLDDGELLPESFCDTIYRIGSAAAPLAEDVVKLLAVSDWDTQWAAADALGAVASSDPACIAALIKALEHPSGIVREAAVRALSSVGRDAVPQLVRSLRDENEELQEMAADALGVIGAEASDAAGDLRRLLNSSAEGVRDWSAIALGKVAASEEAVPRLMTILQLREGPNVRARAAEALGAIGAKAQLALPLLEAALRDDDENVKTAAAGAIAQIVDA